MSDIEYYQSIKLDGPVQYSEWLKKVENIISCHPDYDAVYRDTLASYEPYLKLTNTEQKELKFEANHFIRQLVKKSISPRLVLKVMNANLTEGRQCLLYLKQYFLTLPEELVAFAVEHFANATNPLCDMSPLKRFSAVLYSQYLSVSDFTEARMLYFALDKPLDLKFELNSANHDEFRLSDIKPIIQLLDVAYSAKKRQVSLNKRKPPFCTFCSRTGHLAHKCYRKKSKPNFEPNPQSEDVGSDDFVVL